MPSEAQISSMLVAETRSLLHSSITILCEMSLLLNSDFSHILDIISQLSHHHHHHYRHQDLR